MKNSSKDSGGISWPGEPVPVGTILSFYRKMLAPEKLNGRLLYGFTFPDACRTPYNLFTFKLCFFSHFTEPLTMKAAYDGIVESRPMQDGDIYLGSYNGVNYLGKLMPPMEIFSIIFHLHHTRLLYSFGPEINYYYHTHKAAEGPLLQIISALDSIMHETNAPRNQRCRLLVMALLLQLRHELELQETNMPQYDANAVRLKTFLEHNFHRRINCSLVSDMLGLNRSCASTLFHANFGMTMMDYLKELRLEASKYLLSSNSKIKVKDVSSLCGFDNVCYFIRVFREKYGITPADFRENGHS
ncbi:MAG: helix-turn-helix transcriptional regulator [Victivallales bacterium]|nr:helix-turn-helix transcriptional regulator [Victivallales bacterium]